MFRFILNLQVLSTWKPSKTNFLSDVYIFLTCTGFHWNTSLNATRKRFKLREIMCLATLKNIIIKLAVWEKESRRFCETQRFLTKDFCEVWGRQKSKSLLLTETRGLLRYWSLQLSRHSGGQGTKSENDRMITELLTSKNK